MPFEMCPLCKTAHYRTDPCRPIKHEIVTELERDNPPPKAAEPSSTTPPSRSNTIPPKRAARNAYMKNYMAKRRANAKTAVNNPTAQEVN